MRRCAIATLSSIALAVPILYASAGTAAAYDIPQSSSCTDAGGHPWKGKTIWSSSTYKDSADGVIRAVDNSLSFTSTAADATTVDYSVTSYDGDGNAVKTLRRDDLAFDFQGGTAWVTVDPRNPPSAPGRSKIVLSVGDGNDGKNDCTMTFVQPGGDNGGSTPTSTTPPPTTPPAPTDTSRPSAPPARICGDASVLDGPSTPPSGAVSVPAGDNSNLGLTFRQPGKTFWFAPGVHTLGGDLYSQISPGDGSTFVGAPGAVIDGQKVNRYAFTQKAKDVTIKNLTVRNFVSPRDEGTVNHDAGSGWTMQGLTVTGNGGAGIFVGPSNVARDNCLKDNSQYGFQGISSGGGGGGMVLDHNEIVGNNTGDWENVLPGGCGCTGAGKFWDVRDATVTRNWIHDNHGVGIWGDTDNNNFLIEGNWISDNDGQAIFWETSYNVAIRNNVLQHNLLVTGRKRIASGDDFPDAAIYVSESGGDSRLKSDLVGSATVDISKNLIKDNYNGVTLWENADRFCGSPNNTSTGYCTLVNPSVANLSTCTAATIAKQPYYSDCRWKTQNVKVHDNTFAMDRANFYGCSPSMCGRNAVFSNYGSSPDWSPYQGDVVTKAIVFDQGNEFRNNTYTGGWRFSPLDSYRNLTPAQWQAAPYSQDGGSTFTG